MVHLQIDKEEESAEEIRKYPVIYDRADNGYKDTVMVETHGNFNNKRIRSNKNIILIAFSASHGT